MKKPDDQIDHLAFFYIYYMALFENWLVNRIKARDHDINIQEIESVYDKAHVAVQLVRLYETETNQSILDNISTIARLASGAYGLYNSGENSKILPQEIEQKLIYFGQAYRKSINSIPKKVLNYYFPNAKIRSGDTIRINVERILAEFSDERMAIVEIASTIIHEATHEIERENTGHTSEAGPVAAEKKFKSWFNRNQNRVWQKLNSLRT